MNVQLALLAVVVTIADGQERVDPQEKERFERETKAYVAAKANYDGACKLKLACRLLEEADGEYLNGRKREGRALKDRAEARLELIVQHYPGTQAAVDAQMLLDGKKVESRPLPPVPIAPRPPRPPKTRPMPAKVVEADAPPATKPTAQDRNGIQEPRRPGSSVVPVLSEVDEKQEASLNQWWSDKARDPLTTKSDKAIMNSLVTRINSGDPFSDRPQPMIRMGPGGRAQLVPGSGRPNLQDEIEFLARNWRSCNAPTVRAYLAAVADHWGANQFVQCLRLEFADDASLRDFKARFTFAFYQHSGGFPDFAAALAIARRIKNVGVENLTDLEKEFVAAHGDVFKVGP
jgi:hypothetical protein